MKEPDNQSAPPVLPPQQMGPQPGPPPQRHGTARYVFLFLFFLLAGGFCSLMVFSSVGDALAMPNNTAYTEVTMRAATPKTHRRGGRAGNDRQLHVGGRQHALANSETA